MDDVIGNASDLAVAEAELRLAVSPYAPLRRIRCVYDDGSLTLRGNLPSYYLKQLAQSAVVEICSVRKIDNQIQVMEPVGD